jgi:AcrR family transcriptional regulator
MNNELFDKLSSEKRLKIINAALECFGKDGYKKTAISEIAQRAGIAKASVFQYFGTKRELYLYLFEFSRDQFNDDMASESTDLFEVLREASATKVRVLAKFPAMYDFLMLIYKEEDDEEISRKIKENYETTNIFANVDWSKLKPEVSPEMALNLIRYSTEGYVRDNADKSVDEILAGVDGILNLLIRTIYKEEKIYDIDYRN